MTDKLGEAAPIKPLVPSIIGFALFMQQLDSTAIATALPQIALSLDEDPLNLSLAISAYMLAMAAFLPASGWIADRFGARRVFATSIGVFCFASLLCGQADNLAELVGARVLQGIGGSMIVPVGRLILLRSVPKDQLVKVMAQMTFPALIGPLVGPLIGGFIATYASWRWIFFINVPLGLVGVTLVMRLVSDVREKAEHPFDLLGFLLSAAALSLAMLGVETIGRGAFPPLGTAGAIAAAIVLGAVYWRHSSRVPHSALDPQLFRIRTFSAAVTGGMLYRMGMGAVPFLLPVMLQTGFGLSARDAGALMFVTAGGAICMRPLAGLVLRRAGFRRVLLANAVFSALSTAMLGIFQPATPMALLIAVLFLGGLSRSMQYSAVNSLAFADVPRASMSRANTLSSAAQQVSFSFGVAIGALTLSLTSDWANAWGAEFVLAFAVAGLLAATSALLFRPLPADAGSEVSGHQSR